jgi:hypothetical protein
MITEQEQREKRSTPTLECRDALGDHFRPAPRVAPGGRPAASRASTVGEATLFGALPGGSAPPGAMPARESVRTAG